MTAAAPRARLRERWWDFTALVVAVVRVARAGVRQALCRHHWQMIGHAPGSALMPIAQQVCTRCHASRHILVNSGGIYP